MPDGAIERVLADHADPPAIALFGKFGTREDVLHLYFTVDDSTSTPQRPTTPQVW